MSDVTIELLAPILADIGKITIFISVALMIINLAKNSFSGKDLRL